MSDVTNSYFDSNDLIPLMRVGDLLDVLLGEGESSESLAEVLALADVEINALDDPRGFLSVDAVWRLFSAQISVLNDELVGLGSRPVPVGSMEMVVGRTLHAQTLGSAIEVFVNSVNLLLPDLQLRQWRRNDFLHLDAIFPGAMTSTRQAYLEIACLPWHFTFCWMSRKSLPIARFRSALERNQVAPQLSATFNCEVEFGGQGIEIVYPLGYMDEPLNLPPLVEWRQGMYGVLLEQLRHRQKALYSRDVIEYAKHALRHGVTSQRAVAESAGMSVATLRRRLASRNSRFRDLRDEVLATDALMLIQAGQSVEAVAERLGYADSRSFRRAFKRHFGESPGDYRRRVMGGSSKY